MIDIRKDSIYIRILYENDSKVDFMISDSDMEKLKAVERIKNYGEFSGFPVYGGKM